MESIVDVEEELWVLLPASAASMTPLISLSSTAK